MTIRKAVITAAGRRTRHYPATSAVRKELFPVVDTDGVTKSVMQLIVEEALASGIEEICIVTNPGGDNDFRSYFQRLPPDALPFYASKPWAVEQSERLEKMGKQISYAFQHIQEGYGQAVYCAKEFVGDEPFLLLLGDHVYISNAADRCSRQVINVFEQYETSVVGVKRTPESMLHLFGTVTGAPISYDSKTYKLTEIKEKPTPEYARARLRVSCLPESAYLCLFGIQCLSPAIFDCLEYHMQNNIRERGEIQLTSSLEMLRSIEGFMAVEVDGERYDIGVPAGYIETQMALASKFVSE